ncbi:hypothetical protein GCM10022255_081710 [Dactylosporangium darangshiense]|uniref:Uncharacterized protein n=1 Tax=Dactylosporangium darangshiense TaxID=579108 RepID=A0ABP8DLG2_9ACTN
MSTVATVRSELSTESRAWTGVTGQGGSPRSTGQLTMTVCPAMPVSATDGEGEVEAVVDVAAGWLAWGWFEAHALDAAASRAAVSRTRSPRRMTVGCYRRAGGSIDGSRNLFIFK